MVYTRVVYIGVYRGGVYPGGVHREAYTPLREAKRRVLLTKPSKSLTILGSFGAPEASLFPVIPGYSGFPGRNPGYSRLFLVIPGLGDSKVLGCLLILFMPDSVKNLAWKGRCGQERH